jgi:hypothetical protein
MSDVEHFLVLGTSANVVVAAPKECGNNEVEKEPSMFGKSKCNTSNGRGHG